MAQFKQQDVLGVHSAMSRDQADDFKEKTMLFFARLVDSPALGVFQGCLSDTSFGIINECFIYGLVRLRQSPTPLTRTLTAINRKREFVTVVTISKSKYNVWVS